MNLRCAAVLAWSCSLLFTAPVSPQTKRALLIGINTYQPVGTSATHPPGCTYGRCELGYFENLEGSVNDAQSMADLLTSPKFAFPANQVVLLANPSPPHPAPGLILLPAGQTTRDGILAAMQKYLVDVPERGDTVVFYAASHGSLRVNSKGTKLTVLVNGHYIHADSTLVPSDAYKGGYDVRDREMTRIFNAALDKGVHLTVIFDNCHSGGVTRGIPAKYRERDLPFDPRDIAEAPELLPSGQPRPSPSQRTDNPALVLSAVQQDQTAKEMPDTVPANESHGAFTAALLEAMQVLPADAPAEAVYRRVRAVLGNADVPDEDPDLDATAERREQPLFGGAVSESGALHAAVLATAADGKIWLDVGRVAGIGAGSEFTEIGNGQNIRLRIVASDGIARSIATIVTPAGATVKTGDILELARWVPAQSAPLRVWHWPTLSRADVVAAITQIRAAGVTSVSDPAEEQWTHLLSWNGNSWTLQQAGADSSIKLGPILNSDTLRQKVPSRAKLWINLPLSHEVAAQLLPPDPTSSVQSSPNLAGAHYV
ncbi:MAG TPA: caspase family protein, partial [Acidobacteriaceae bacterium]|nr:caspase family protein [Acidobacteriaceae bacterium]